MKPFMVDLYHPNILVTVVYCYFSLYINAGEDECYELGFGMLSFHGHSDCNAIIPALFLTAAQVS
jgi:hypothetical protein